MAKSYDDWRKTITDEVSSNADYQAAKAKVDQATAAKPTYAGTYDNDVAQAYSNLLNREGFKYSLDDDAMYKQYADKYMQAGKLSMKDTMGQAAALTGGYGSSYGQAVGQQAYDKYLQGLSDVALEMYDRAYGRYQDEGQRLKDAYGLAQDMAETEYGRYRDDMGQWNTDVSRAQSEADTAWNRGYQIGSDAYSRSVSEEQQEYDRSLDYAQSLAAYGDFSGFAEIFGEDRAAAMQKVWNSGNPDLAYNSGKISAEEYRAMTGVYPAGYQAAGTGGSGNYYDSYYWNNVAPNGPGKKNTGNANTPTAQEIDAWERQYQEELKKQQQSGGGQGGR